MMLAITSRFKSVSLLLLILGNSAMHCMESSQQHGRLTSWESPRQKKQLPTVEEIKNLEFKRKVADVIGVYALMLGYCIAFYSELYPCDYDCRKTGDYPCEVKFRDTHCTAIRSFTSIFMGMVSCLLAGAYLGKLNTEVETSVFKPLKEAIKNENVHDVQELIAADVNMQNYGLTPLRISLREKKPEITKMLLERGAHPERGDHSALFDCVDHADLPMFELLLKHKANPNAVCNKPDCCGQTILNYAIACQRAHSHKAECVQLLINHGADPRQKNPKDKKDSYHMDISLEIAELLQANKG